MIETAITSLKIHITITKLKDHVFFPLFKVPLKLC